jgi:hypothetical protein
MDTWEYVKSTELNKIIVINIFGERGALQNNIYFCDNINSNNIHDEMYQVI